MALRTVTLGPDGPAVPALGIGTWNMERDDRKSAVQAIRRSIELGATVIDTAEMYGSGRVEEIVGEAIDGLREEVFLVTKVLPSNASRKGTRRALEASLERLGADHVDLYLLHWPSAFPIGDTMAAFRELVDEGLTRHVGVSNFALGEFDEAQQAIGERPLVTDQVLYWLGARGPEGELLPGLAERGVPLMAYSPFGSGRLPTADRGGGQALTAVAERHGVSPHQVALAWVMRHEHVLAIPKASSAAHVEDNVASLKLTLEDDDLVTLDEAFPAPDQPRLEFL